MFPHVWCQSGTGRNRIKWEIRKYSSKTCLWQNLDTTYQESIPMRLGHILCSLFPPWLEFPAIKLQKPKNIQFETRSFVFRGSGRRRGEYFCCHCSKISSPKTLVVYSDHVFSHTVLQPAWPAAARRVCLGDSSAGTARGQLGLESSEGSTGLPF